LPASTLSVAQDVGYPMLFGLIAIETMGIPEPGEPARFTVGNLAAVTAGLVAWLVLWRRNAAAPVGRRGDD